MKQLKQLKLVCGCIALKAMLALSACSSSDLGQLESPSLAAALDDQPRVVTVYIVANRELGFAPSYVDRIIYAEPIVSNTVVRAEAKTTVQGINTVIVGDSCESLSRSYANLQECKSVDSISRQYGDTEATAATDTEGFASLSLGAGAYRISMQSWVSAEDQKCNWTGSAILPENSSSLELPILVYCE